MSDKVFIPGTKAEMCIYYGFSRTKLHRLMNVRYYDELEKLGYDKNDKLLSPDVVRRFLELWGKQLKDDEV